MIKAVLASPFPPKEGSALHFERATCPNTIPIILRGNIKIPMHVKIKAAVAWPDLFLSDSSIVLGVAAGYFAFSNMLL